MFDRFFSKKEPDKWNVDKINKIVDAYSAHLMKNPGPIEDESRLPFNKSDIKRAILLAIYGTPDSESRVSLKSGYLRLSSFQNLSPAEIAAVKQTDAAFAIKPNANNLVEIAKMISCRGDIYQKLNKRSLEESCALQGELDKVLSMWKIA